MSILRKNKDISQLDLDKSREIIQCHIYDGYGFLDITEDTPCQERREALKNLFKNVPFIHVVEYKIVNNLDELYQVYESFVEDGYEGAMYRTLNAPYIHRRSADLLKVKPENDSDGFIVAIHEGKGNWSGVAAKASIKWGEEEFDATFKGTLEQKAQILKEPKKWIGKKVEFLYNSLTGLGIPNFARIDVDNCFKE